MRLTIANVQSSDYGNYKCVAKNPRGDMDGNIKLYSKSQNFCFIYILKQHNFIQHGITGLEIRNLNTFAVYLWRPLMQFIIFVLKKKPLNRSTFVVIPVIR